MPEEKAVSKIKREFSLRRKKVKRIIIITKNAKILDLPE
jgi:hypothetical protein